MSNRSFWLHDYLHGEGLGPFPSREEAIAEAVRVAAIPWDAPPNLAPCVNWETCGRDYGVVELDASADPPIDMDAPLIVQIDRNGARWLIDPSSDITTR